jgi:hypothetical protein
MNTPINTKTSAFEYLAASGAVPMTEIVLELVGGRAVGPEAAIS